MIYRQRSTHADKLVSVRRAEARDLDTVDAVAITNEAKDETTY